MNKWILVLWPSFLMAGIAEIIFFTVVDPQTLYFFGQPVNFSAMATYTIGFFALWLVCIASSLATLFFERSREQINGHS
ncbi:hypothetical protein ACDA63_12745 [Uliginosibacterium sp. sgz301328]|uniref:hypothetical protein n=1 Tax=Uliginosibacterium sp. sgz301328 TaxID=3243764 RepID=UPI00359DF9CA